MHQRTNHAYQKFKNHRKSISVSWPVSVKQTAKSHCLVTLLSLSVLNKRLKSHCLVKTWGKGEVVFYHCKQILPLCQCRNRFDFLIAEHTWHSQPFQFQKTCFHCRVQNRSCVCHFWIQNNSFRQLHANENGINNIDLHLIDSYQSTSPKPHQSGAPFASVRRFPKEQWYRAGVFFFSPPPPLCPSFALAPTLRVTIFTLPNLPSS